MATMNENFFTELEGGATWSAGVAFKRSNPLPLDRYSVFATKALAETYATTNAVAYPGQIIAVLEDGKMVAYVLNGNGESLVLEQIGIIPTGDGKTISVTEDGEISLLGAANATAGQQLRIANKGTAEEPKLELEWFTPSTDTVDGLQSAVGALQETVDGVVAEDGTVTKEGLTHRVNALEGVVGDAKGGLVKDLADEIARAKGAEEALGKRIDDIDYVDEGELADAIKDFETKENVGKVEKKIDDYVTSNDLALAGVKATADAAATKTYTDEELAKKAALADFNALKGRVEAFLDNTGAATDAIDTLQELIAYIESHDGIDLTTVLADIQALKDRFNGVEGTVAAYVGAAIEALKIGDYAKAADLTALAGRVATLESKVDVEKVSTAISAAITGANLGQYATTATLNQKVSDLQGEIATAKGEATGYTDTKLADYYTKTEIAGLNHATKQEVADAVKAEADIARAAEKANADAIAAIKDSDTIDSFADVVTALAGKQDKLTEGEYATKAYVDGQVKNLADGDVAKALGDAAKGIADAAAAKSVADEANARSNTNYEEILVIHETLTGKEPEEGAEKTDHGVIGRIAAVEAWKDVHNGEFTTLKNTSDNHGTRIGNLETDVNKAKSDINSINEGIDGINNNINYISSATGQLEEDVYGMWSPETGALQGGLVDQVATLGINLGETNGVIATLATKEELEAEIDRATKAEAALGDTIDNLSGRVTTIQNGFIADFEAIRNNEGTGRLDIAEKDIDTLQDQIKMVSGAMHFRGVVTTDPTSADFSIEGYAIGDVVIYGNKEYVLAEIDVNDANQTGKVTKFVEFGDATGNASAITALDERVKELEDYDHAAAHATTKSEAIAAANAYADGLAGNYATAVQGAKADTAVQTVEAAAGLTATKVGDKVTIGIDETHVFILCGGKANTAPATEE